VFDFVLFAFYTLIISHHICCFSVHSIAKLSAQPSVFDVPEFSPIFTLKQLKTPHHQNIRLLRHQNLLQHTTSACASTINKDIKKPKTANFSHYTLLYFTHSNYFHILFYRKVISENTTHH